MSGRLASQPPEAGPPAEPPAEAVEAGPRLAPTEPELDEASRGLLDYLIENTWEQCLRDLRDAREQTRK